jgi:hypothetical protein
MIIPFFRKRKLVIASMHQKEAVLSPLLEKHLDVEIVLTSDLNTDDFGTFSGEKERALDQVATARKKCELAMDISGCDLAIASEGSFGAHPEIFFLPCDEEILLLYDKKNKLEIIASHRSSETNYGGSDIQSIAELLTFAQKVGFPSHGLILKDAATNFSKVVKGIINEENLIKEANKFLQSHGRFYVETDMRAMYNPSRMKVIESTAVKLIEKINSACPICKAPGFGVDSIKLGLPCSLCSTPTNSILSAIYQCLKCGHTESKDFPSGKKTEDPMYCDHCNP